MTHEIPPLTGRQNRFSLLAAQVGQAINSGNLEVAAHWSRIALDEGIAHPTFLNLAAWHEMQQGRPEKALGLLMRAKAMAPKDMNVVNAIGTCYAALGDLPAALAAYDAAILGAPELAAAYYNRGIAHDTVGDFAKSRADFEQAVTLRPDYPEALARLAYAAAIRGDGPMARDYAGRALRHDPAQVTATIACAMADISERRFAAAEQRLARELSSPHLTGDNRAIVLSLIGDARDGAGDPAGAFSAYAESNTLMRWLYVQLAADAVEPPLAQIKRLGDYFAQGSQWTPGAKAAGERPGPVFLVGFPRSGTTLLEQALAGHPDIATSEERNFLTDAVADFLLPGDGLERLAKLPPEETTRYRNAYWNRAGKMAPAHKIFVDKLPLNTVFLPLIAKIFPEARIIFARRDPRDVVFSCFRRRFAMNPQMYELLTLEGAARYYDAVMTLAALYRERLGLAWRDMVHEALVRDFEAELRGLCDFLGLEWNTAMGDFAARLAVRSVDTPTSGQLVKGLNREGIGSWRRYHEQMRPVLGLLAPWVDRFGYPAD